MLRFINFLMSLIMKSLIKATMIAILVMFTYQLEAAPEQEDIITFYGERATFNVITGELDCGEVTPDVCAEYYKGTFSDGLSQESVWSGNEGFVNVTVTNLDPPGGSITFVTGPLSVKYYDYTSWLTNARLQVTP